MRYGNRFTRGLIARGHSAFILTGKMNASLAPCALAGDPLATTVYGHRNASGATVRFFARADDRLQTFTHHMSALAPAPPSDRSDRSDRSDTAVVFLSVVRIRVSEPQATVCSPSHTTCVRGLQPRLSDRSDRSDRSDTAVVFLSVVRIRVSEPQTTVCRPSHTTSVRGHQPPPAYPAYSAYKAYSPVRGRSLGIRVSEPQTTAYRCP